MLDDEALDRVAEIRSRALVRGDLQVVRECDLVLGRRPRLAENPPAEAETTEAPALENTAQPRPARRRR